MTLLSELIIWGIIFGKRHFGKFGTKVARICKKKLGHRNRMILDPVGKFEVKMAF